MLAARQLLEMAAVVSGELAVLVGVWKPTQELMPRQVFLPARLPVFVPALVGFQKYVALLSGAEFSRYSQHPQVRQMSQVLQRQSTH